MTSCQQDCWNLHKQSKIENIGDQIDLNIQIHVLLVLLGQVCLGKFWKTSIEVILSVFW